MNPAPKPKPIYLDYNATTPVDPRVAAAMRPFLEDFHGNPSSGHIFGQQARAAIEQARDQVASFLKTSPESIVFTSGGTESNNHAIIGAATANPEHGKHIVTSAVEHPAVTEVCRYLEGRGFQTTYVGVDKFGMVDAEEMIAAFTPQTVLVTLMHANNEVGTIQPVAQVAAAARQRGILVHSDCAQSTGKISVTMPGLGVDLLSVAGHKLYAPKGIGVLCLGEGVVLPNLIFGAGHEGGRRPGTENILEIVGLGTACEIAAQDLEQEARRLTRLRDNLQIELLANLSDVQVHGHPTDRLPNTLSIGFAGASAQDIMAAMPEIAVSAGAACHGGGEILSQVLAAMGVSLQYGRGTLRISLGKMTQEQDLDAAIAGIVAAVHQAREANGQDG